MKAPKMPSPNEMVWYKWFPAKAMTSLRWTSLTLEQEGFYRRLYDLASLAQPSSRRGWFYEHGQPARLQDVLHSLRIHHSKGRALVKQLASKGLMTQDENGAWGFPNFAKHQHNTPLRPRSDGLGSAESARNRPQIGRADTDVDVDVDKEKETDKEKPVFVSPKVISIPPELSNLATRLFGGDPIALAEWVEVHGVEQVQIALRILAGYPKDRQKPRYAEGILRNRAKDGYPAELQGGAETPEQEEARIKEFWKEKPK